MSGQYGFSLYYKKNISDLAEKNFLMVDANTSISSVAKIAMEREMDALYDFIVVKEEDKYAGIVRGAAFRLATGMELLSHFRWCP